MATWKEVLGHLVVDVEDHYDMLKYRLRERIGNRDPIMIRAYRGCGTPERFYIKGRVLEDKGITPAADNDSLWVNLLNMYRRFESDEIPYAKVVARYQGVEQEVTCDEEGFFELWIDPQGQLLPGHLWQTVELDLLEPQREGQGPVKAEGQVFVPPPTAQFGVISDIDDTVLQTNAAQLLSMARTVFLGNARTRLPFKGVAAFYRALFRGPGGAIAPKGSKFVEGENPLFYISSSPWNLYGLLTEFFQLQDIPIGPILFLRDWGISKEEFLPTGHRSHKLKAIRTLMELYPRLPFILIGDSGQEDPEIYAEAVSLYPKRILAIYIRNVSRDLKRPEAIHELAKQVAGAGSTLILAEDTLPMAEHAAAQGWIAREALPGIEVEKAADEAPPTKLEELLGEPEKPATPTVVVDTASPEQTKQAVDEGAIEEALEKGKGDKGEGDKKEPPEVVLK